MTGCHRSGTSLLTSFLLELTGIQPGDSAGDLSPQLDNPMGFFESRRLTDLNDSLLASIGFSWNRIPILSPCWDSVDHIGKLSELRASMSAYALNSRWVDKDPRLSLTFPAYFHILLKRVPLAVVLRKPLDVATSLYNRDAIEINAGLALWFLYNHHISTFIEEDDLLVTFSNLLESSDLNCVSKIKDSVDSFLLKRLNIITSSQSWESAVNTTIVKSLDRSSYSLPKSQAKYIEPSLLSFAETSYNYVDKEGSTLKSFQEAFSSLPMVILDALRKYKLCVSIMNQEDADHDSLILENELKDTQARLIDYDLQLKAIKASTIWRITSPIRYLLDKLS